MILNSGCGLNKAITNSNKFVCSFRKICVYSKTNFLKSLNYIFDIVYERAEILKKISALSPEQIYFLLKGPEFEHASGQKFVKKIRECQNNFNNLGHHLSGANFHIFNYHNEQVKDLIWQMKFNDNKNVAKIFGYCLFKNLYESKIRSRQLKNFFEKKCLLIAIPIHRRRFFERGYNQCDWLCKEIVLNLNKVPRQSGCQGFNHKIIYRPKALRRLTYTKKQSWTKESSRDKNDQARKENIKGVFSVNKKYLNEVKNSNVILVDDVFTTGATIGEASRVLRNSGAGDVISFTIAR